MLITLSGTMVISCLVNIVQGGGGGVLPRFGMLENSPKTVKCVITFETDCRTTVSQSTISQERRFEDKMDRVSRGLRRRIFGAIDQILQHPRACVSRVLFGGRKTVLVLVVSSGSGTCLEDFTNPMKQRVLPPDKKPLFSFCSQQQLVHGSGRLLCNYPVHTFLSFQIYLKMTTTVPLEGLILR